MALVAGLLRQGLHQTLDAKLGGGEGAPVGQALAANAIRGEDDGGVGGLPEEGQAGLGEQEGCGQVDAQNPLPLAGVIVIDAAEEGREGGAVGQAIQPAEFPPNRGRYGGILRLVARLQVQGQDGGLRGARRGDPVIEGL